MKTIDLTQGHVALVDNEDFEVLNVFKWHAAKLGNTFYACRSILIDGKYKTIRMHNVVMGGTGIDHRDGDGCNNQRANLRFATAGENGMNRKKQASASSAYKGVSWKKRDSKWQAGIKINGKSINLGLFDTEVDAARAYNEKAISLFCEFANLNKI